jgi:hypothetical protein
MIASRVDRTFANGRSRVMRPADEELVRNYRNRQLEDENRDFPGCDTAGRVLTAGEQCRRLYKTE